MNVNRPYRLEVREKTGFRNITGNPVTILDERGIVFYDTRDLENRVHQFNLPIGNYLVERGKITRMQQPVAHPLMPMPNVERNKKAIPQNFTILFAENPNKATIGWREKAIVLDPQFKNAPLPILRLILEHEFGHKYYESEDLADRYAYNAMIKAGYNPSQIAFGLVHTLSGRQIERKNVLVSNMEIVNGTANNDYDHYDMSDYNHYVNLTLGNTYPDFNKLTANDVIGGKLLTEKSVSIYNRPNGSIIKTAPANTEIGWIFSWITYDGETWFQLDGGDGKGNAGFVKSAVGSFDFETLKQSIIDGIDERNAKIEKEADKRQINFSNPFGFIEKLFDNLPLVILLVLILIFLPQIKTAMK